MLVWKTAIMGIKPGQLEVFAIIFAYNVKKYSPQETMPQWASGWEVLCTSENDQATRLYGYKAVVLVNHSTKVLHIASAGTMIREVHDLWDDFRVFFGRVPNKFVPAKSLVDQVIKQLGGQQEALKYEFNCCGHSLGAVVSDLMMAEILSRDLNFKCSRTYDTPGSKNIVNSVITQKLLSGCGVVSLEHLANLSVESYTGP